MSQVLAFGDARPPAIASLLRIKIDERIYFSRRVRYVDGKPLMLEDSYMPVKLFRNLSLSHLEGSKLIILRKSAGSSAGTMNADASAGGQAAGALNERPEQTPLLRITSLSYSDSGDFLTIRSCSATPASIRWTITCAASRRKARLAAPEQHGE